MMRPAAVVQGVSVARPSRKESASLKMRSISSISRSSIETMSYFGRRAIELRLASADHDRVDAVNFMEAHMHPLIGLRDDILADVVRADRQFALSAIDQHRELNRIGAAEIS